ncbi:MAG: hypothetical protein MdMp014T_1010 [Treponematales bacterium]
MDNSVFCDVLKETFRVYLMTNPRSNEKLKVLHKAIAEDLLFRLGADYTVESLGIGSGKEGTIEGRYVDKQVDITIRKDSTPVAGIAVKYVMSNYMQNSNNYFENMLGETANIRCADIQYFQVFIIPDKIPYFDHDGRIPHWEEINEHNLGKYITLSQDNIKDYKHTPDKTLIFLVHLSGAGNGQIRNRAEYVDYYTNNSFTLTLANKTFTFGKAIIYNDYPQFAEKVIYAILSV